MSLLKFLENRKNGNQLGKVLDIHWILWWLIAIKNKANTEIRINTYQQTMGGWFNSNWTNPKPEPKQHPKPRLVLRDIYRNLLPSVPSIQLNSTHMFICPTLLLNTLNMVNNPIWFISQNHLLKDSIARQANPGCKSGAMWSWHHGVVNTWRIDQEEKGEMSALNKYTGKQRNINATRSAN